jgi:alkylation response protein AidB-like acyl-CoA dehydrogenase
MEKENSLPGKESSSCSIRPVPMNFELSQEQMLLRDMARKFAEQEMLPSLREYESARNVNYELLKKMAPLGLRGIHISNEHGGSGLSYSDAVIIWEQLSRASWTQTLISLGDSVLAGTMQRSQFGKPIASFQ